jgi:redox-sensitive bicupin YhaK (pirin superfamily)
MTAGGGVLHIEKPTEELVRTGGVFLGVQLWINLPRAQKWVEPRTRTCAATSPCCSPRRTAACWCGSSPVTWRATTYTSMAMLHATVSPGARVRLPRRPDFNALVYVLAGDGTVGAERRPISTGQLALFGPGDAIVLDGADRQESRYTEMEVIVLGGAPIREPVAARS